MIGIGLTTRNRSETARNTYNKIMELGPHGWFKLAVVDDASDLPFEGSTYRFEQNAGVGSAKNKCLELLEGCEHMFLFDDDCSPVVDEWWLPYINSGLNHAAYTFDRMELNRTSKYVSYEYPNGCMLYFTRKCIDTAGGWDTEFQGYGWDHCELSRRIYNMGLTPAQFVDIPNSAVLFQMADCESSFSYETRAATIPINAELYQQKYFSKEFKPYK